ncbi:MAG: hypothetical protein C0467_32210 [Planctomycetaceae bacterium]|nr:hypothetical protein [Planctomycetaceae bacterium]
MHTYTEPEELTMSATATMNGKPQRKQLGDQLDRLDSIIDALAEGLPGAVADACRDGARLAVKDAILEIIGNPELRALIAPQHTHLPSPPAPTVPEPAPAPEPKPSLWSRLKAKVAAVRDSLTGATTKAKDAVATRYAAAKEAVVAVGRATGEAFPLQRVGLVASSVGLVVGVACLLVPQTMSAAVGAIGAVCTTVSVQTGFWLRKAALRVGLMS